MLHVEFLSQALCYFMRGVLLHAPCYFMWGVSLHTPCSFIWGVCLTHPMLCYVGSFSYKPNAILCREFLLHTPCYVTWEVSLTRPYVMWGVSLTRPHAILCGEFLLYTPCYFMWGALINSLVCWSYLCWICVVCRCRRRECLSSGWRSAQWSGRTEDLDSKTHATHANHFSTLLYSLSFITKGCFWEFTYCKQDSKPIQYTFIQSQFYYKGLLLRVYIL